MTHDPDTGQILSSESFRLLNAHIDELAAEVRQLDLMISGTCGRIAGMDPENPHHVREIRTRTYEEQRAGAQCPSMLDIKSQMENLASMGRRREDLIEQIRQQQVLKLRLLNDYDFTRGDNSFQREILFPEDAGT